MQTLTVKARVGLLVPREDDHRTYITQHAVTVPATVYYLRRVADGDLIRIEPKAKGDK